MSLRSSLVWEIGRAGVRNRVRQVFLKVVNKVYGPFARENLAPGGARVQFINGFFTAGSAG
jgi:hypothetical protein